jgi:hypothetical protein
MTEEDCLASFIYTRFVLAAVNRGEAQVTIKVDEVGQLLNAHRLNAIHSMLSSEKFAKRFSIIPLNVQGPSQDPNPAMAAEYTFRLHRLLPLPATLRTRTIAAQPASPGFSEAVAKPLPDGGAFRLEPIPQSS